MSRLNIKPILLSLLALTTLSAQATTYWVAKNGSDSNPCSVADPCLTIQKGVHKLQAGDTLNVRQGIYFERAHKPDGTLVNFFERTGGIALWNSGTPSNRIIIQADPAAPSDSVVIDQQNIRTGFIFNTRQDYITINGFIFQNIHHSAITSLDNNQGSYNDGDESVSRGVIIEKNKIYNVDTVSPPGESWPETGINNAGIRMDSSRAWIVRNNLIDGVYVQGRIGANSGAIEAYNIDDALIENNILKNAFTGVYWKASPTNIPGYPRPQSIIRFNRLENLYRATHFDGNSRPTARYNIITNNIFRNVYQTAYVNGHVNEAHIDFTNNFVDYGDFSSSSSINEGLTVRGSDGATLPKRVKAIGNIFHGSIHRNFNFIDANNLTEILDIDYNIYTGGPDVYVHGGNSLNSLSAWRGFSHSILKDLDQGSHSLENQPVDSLANNASHGDYTLPLSSPARAFFPNGNNAGPYQTGNETIGIYGSNLGNTTSPPSPPSPPHNLNLSISN